MERLAAAAAVLAVLRRRLRATVIGVVAEHSAASTFLSPRLADERVSTESTLQEATQEKDALLPEAAACEAAVVLHALANASEEVIVDDPGHGNGDPFRAWPFGQNEARPLLGRICGVGTLVHAAGISIVIGSSHIPLAPEKP
jgi:hypothetical protein